MYQAGLLMWRTLSLCMALVILVFWVRRSQGVDGRLGCSPLFCQWPELLRCWWRDGKEFHLGFRFIGICTEVQTDGRSEVLEASSVCCLPASSWCLFLDSLGS